MVSFLISQSQTFFIHDFLVLFTMWQVSYVLPQVYFLICPGPGHSSFDYFPLIISVVDRSNYTCLHFFQRDSIDFIILDGAHLRKCIKNCSFIGIPKHSTTFCMVFYMEARTLERDLLENTKKWSQVFTPVNRGHIQKPNVRNTFGYKTPPYRKTRYECIPFTHPHRVRKRSN